MKLIKYLLLMTWLMSLVNCSPASQTTTENVSVTLPTNSNSSAANEVVTPEMQAQKNAIDALVKDLYKQHDAQKSPFFQTKNRALVDKYFDKNLADLIWKDANESKGEVGVIGFDPLYNAQDVNIKDFSVASPKITGDKGSVAVSFDNLKEKQTVTYTLARQNSAWKISDINYGGGNTLLAVFKNHADHQANSKIMSGEFEGTYQVGDTTCTVKPMETAFEVRWKQGAGAEMFFAGERGGGGDKITFSSKPKKGQPNVFSFDDENYSTGTFYRADGVELPLKRIK